MPSTSIYTNPALPYVYRVENKTTDELYIGSRWANKLPAHLDFGIKYKTSSKKVEPIFDQFSWEIVAEFPTGVEAYDHEQFLIYQCWGNPLLLNGHCTHGKERWIFCNHMSEEEEEKEKRRGPRKNPCKIGRPQTEETKEKIRQNPGNPHRSTNRKPLTEEHKNKISDSMKKRNQF